MLVRFFIVFECLTFYGFPSVFRPFLANIISAASINVNNTYFNTL